MALTVDGVLREWGDRLFYRLPGKSGNCVSVTGSRIAKNSSVVATVRCPRVMKAALGAAGRRAPEVMVKISGSGKGAKHLHAHLNYISRNGSLPLETEEGHLVEGRAAVRDLADEWKYGLFGMSDEGRRRESLNVVLSMPPGTDPDSLRAAASGFAKRQFSGNHPYALVAHHDEEHPHVHLCVKVMGRDGTRLNPRKADLQIWRESFADLLRESGVDACATPRSARGVRTRTRTQAAYHHKTAGSIQSLSRGAYASEDSQLRSYAVLANQLSHAGKEGAQLALDVLRIASRMPGTQAAIAERGTQRARQTPSLARTQEAKSRER